MFNVASLRKSERGIFPTGAKDVWPSTRRNYQISLIRLLSTRARVTDSDQTVQRGIGTYGRSETFGSRVCRFNDSAKCSQSLGHAQRKSADMNTNIPCQKQQDWHLSLRVTSHKEYVSSWHLWSMVFLPPLKEERWYVYKLMAKSAIAQFIYETIQKGKNKNPE